MQVISAELAGFYRGWSILKIKLRGAKFLSFLVLEIFHIAIDIYSTPLVINISRLPYAIVLYEVSSDIILDIEFTPKLGSTSSTSAPSVVFTILWMSYLTLHLLTSTRFQLLWPRGSKRTD